MPEETCAERDVARRRKRRVNDEAFIILGWLAIVNYSDYINYSDYKLFMIKTSNEVAPHSFELGVGVGMFEEEVALAELEVEEGTHFGVVS